jgi:hypothetical protein
VPISLERELEIEREVDAIMRELDRRPLLEKPTLAKPRQVVQLPWAPPLLLDE